MNAPNSQLDPFETALLGELRDHVTTRVRPHRRRRWAAGLVAASAAGAVAVVGLGGGVVGTTPAYAVEIEETGDVVVTVNRLEDAAGLEADLRDAGIDATVAYNPDADLTMFGVPYDPDLVDQVTHVSYPNDAPPCEGGGAPATLSRSGDGWELRIPVGSPAQDRRVWIGTSVDEELTLTYRGDLPFTLCDVVSQG